MRDVDALDVRSVVPAGDGFDLRRVVAVRFAAGDVTTFAPAVDAGTATGAGDR